MKENSLGPQKWAFVVISGGAACALPFVHIGEPKTTNPPRQYSQLEFNYGLSGVGTANTPAVAPPVEQQALPLPSQKLPEWANASRSPFDDLVGITAASREPQMPSDSLPLQPLQPWITGPGDRSSPSGTDSALRSTGTALPPFRPEVASGSVASAHTRPPEEASPWRDQPHMWTSLAPTSQPSAQALAAGSAAVTWPDQNLTAEEVAKLTRPERPQLASATVAPTAPLGQTPAELAPTNQMIPSLTHNPNTRPVAAQLRFGQSPTAQNNFMPGSVAANNADVSRASTAPALPKLPEARKKHIIFQPSVRQ